MYPTNIVGIFLCLLEWFSKAQLLQPTRINEKVVGCLFYDSSKNHILWNDAFKLFEDVIYNKNKTQYRYFHTHTETKSAFILNE